MSPTPFSIETEAGPDGPLVMMTGELDLATAPQLEDLVALLKTPDATAMTLDLAQLTFIDSTGISKLVHLYNAAEEQQIHLVLLTPTPRVLRVLQLTGLDTVLDIRHEVPNPNTA